MNVDGRCHCGKISYEAVVDPAVVGLCHCSDCQMLSGTAFRVAVPAPVATFRLLQGEPRTYVKTADSGNRRVHAFCADCGTPVYSCAETDPVTYSLRIGCLRQKAEFRPRIQMWCDSALPWAMNLEALPKRPRQ